jgi:zinc transporter ZupT
MIEILLLIALTRRVGHILKDKGRKSGWYKLLTVVLWFGGEIVGAIIGVVIAQVTGAGQALVYLVALIGAGAGAAVAFMLAKSVPPAATYGQPPPPPPPTFT